jgi:hypothetical protein
MRRAGSRPTGREWPNSALIAGSWPKAATPPTEADRMRLVPDHGFKINHAAIRQMTQEIEREFAKNPVRVPIELEDAETVSHSQPEQDELALLRALNNAGSLTISSKVDPSDLGLDLPDERVEAAAELALADRYITMPTFGGQVHLTQLGRQRAQRTAVARPSTIVHNNFSGATITGSNIATGNHSSQTVSTATVDVELLRTFRSEALALIDSVALGADELEHFEADLEVIDAQLVDPTVKRKGLKRALLNIEQIAINAAGGAAGSGLAVLISQLV